MNGAALVRALILALMLLLAACTGVPSKDAKDMSTTSSGEIENEEKTLPSMDEESPGSSDFALPSVFDDGSADISSEVQSSLLYERLLRLVRRENPKKYYIIGESLGEGSSGRVYRTVRRGVSEGALCAIKMLPLNSRKNVVHALRDLYFLQELNGIPWVPSFEAAFFNNGVFYVSHPWYQNVHTYTQLDTCAYICVFVRSWCSSLSTEKPCQKWTLICFQMLQPRESFTRYW